MSLRHFAKNVVQNKDRDRWQWWPVRLMWRERSTHLVDWHGWQVANERVDVSKTSARCVPGYRAVFGQTFHFGPLKICFGRNRDACSEVAP